MNDDERRHGAMSDPPSAPPGEKERAIREVCARIAAAAQRAEPKGADERRRDATPPPTEAGTTLRSPPQTHGPAGLVSSHPPVVTMGGVPPNPPAQPATMGGVPPNPPPASLGPVAQAPAFLTSTAPLPDLGLAGLAKGGALPFRPAPAPPPPPRRPAPRTVQSRVVGLGGTASAGDDAMERAVAAVTSPVPVPHLTLRQFASLCAELAFQPERRSEILDRYRVRGEAAYAALDAYWRRERAARPEARTAFADDFASHLAWLHVHCK